MKKLILGIALTCFIAFGTFSVQYAYSSVDNVEIVQLNLDDDPKEGSKAEAKTDGKDKKGTKASNKSSSKSSCKEFSSKCQTKTHCCPSKSTKSNDKKEGGDKK
ncbi:MAG: hypothetical protein ABFS05_13445 [Bacteroidota bacterium]